MINAIVFRNEKDVVYGFEIENHGSKEVCSAVSMLSINTVNAIEAYTDAVFSVDFDEDGGFLHIEVENLKNNDSADDAELLLNTLLLGLRSIENEYENELKLNDKVVNINDKN